MPASDPPGARSGFPRRGASTSCSTSCARSPRETRSSARSSAWATTTASLPAVIQRNILENPGWYTAYTPYQAEIAQGRLEALLNFQTMVADLTGLPLANASLLDEATAAAEAMHMCHAVGRRRPKRAFFVAADCHPQTIAVVRTRAVPLGIDAFTWGDPATADLAALGVFGVLVQYPTTDGVVARLLRSGGPRPRRRAPCSSWRPIFSP